MANLYEIKQAMLECIDSESGEVIDIEKLSALSMERDEKLENIALWIKNLLSDAEALKKEKEAFAARETAAKNKADRLKSFLAEQLAGEKFATAKVSVSFRETASVRIAENAVIPKEFIRHKETDEPDKVALKKALDAGKSISGVTLEKTRSVQIR